MILNIPGSKQDFYILSKCTGVINSMWTLDYISCNLTEKLQDIFNEISEYRNVIANVNKIKDFINYICSTEALTKSYMI